MKPKALAIFLTLFVACFLATGSIAYAEKAIRIGVTAPLQKEAGIGDKNGAVMAAEEINAAGGIKGHKMELILGDVEGQDAGTVLSVVRKLITRDNVDIMMTGAISPGCVEYPLMQSMKMPYLQAAYAQTHIERNGPCRDCRHF